MLLLIISRQLVYNEEIRSDLGQSFAYIHVETELTKKNQKK